MQSRQNHQGRFSVFWTGKGAGNRQEAAETLWGRLRRCGQQMLW